MGKEKVKVAEVQRIERERAGFAGWRWQGSRLIWREQMINETIEMTPPMTPRMKSRLLVVARVWGQKTIGAYFTFVDSANGGGLEYAWKDVCKFFSLTDVQFAMALIEEAACGYDDYLPVVTPYPRSVDKFHKQVAFWKESERAGSKRSRREKKLIEQLSVAALAHDGRKIYSFAKPLFRIWEGGR